MASTSATEAQRAEREREPGRGRGRDAAGAGAASTACYSVRAMRDPREVPDAFYVPEGARFVATGHTRGPWSAGHQHAGPPSALLARSIERAMADDPALRVMRLAVELMAPVPIATIEVATTVLRAGRKVRRVEAVLTADGRSVARAAGLAIRTEAVPVPPVRPDLHEMPAPPEGGTPWTFPVFQGGSARGGYIAAVDARCVRGGVGENPTTVWIRSRVALVAGESPSPLQRVMIAADSGNGIAIVLDPERFTFVNADLTVHLHRLPVDEWVCLEAITAPEPDGIGLTRSRLFDRRGSIGYGLQTLVVEARRRETSG
ncbi:MAG TPA: thioesterase family protein [Candidatus Binatia bacterium]|nr:thioesterase family protein [Candidatus Binatia bacterium]